jgi:hypothetical protein
MLTQLPKGLSKAAGAGGGGGGKIPSIFRA